MHGPILLGALPALALRAMGAESQARIRRRPTGLPPRARAMWTGLYRQNLPERLPWAVRNPFPPLAPVVKLGWLSPPGPILDIGCGVGSNARWLASRRYRVTGVEIAPGAISAAEASLGHRVKNPSYLVDDVLASALRPSTFQGAVDVGCFQTLSPRLRRPYAASVSRLLVPGAPLALFWVGRE